MSTDLPDDKDRTEVPVETDRLQSNPNGRTLYDAIYAGRWVMLVLVLLTIGLAVILSGRISIDYVALREQIVFYEAVLISPFVGAALAKYAVNQLRVPVVVLQTTDTKTLLTVRYDVPETLFSQFNKSGNSLVGTTPSGSRLYYCESVDLETKTIVYSWPHTLPSAVVVSDLEYYDSIVKNYNVVSSENIKLTNHCEAVAIGLSRDTVGEVLDGIKKALHMTKEKVPEQQPEKDQDGGIHSE